MGQVLKKLQEVEKVKRRNQPAALAERFPDLAELPPELSISVLSHLNPTDLCLAACVWENLANDEILWQGLCKGCWGYVSAYSRCCNFTGLSYKKLFLLLDEASLTFNGDAFEGIDYLTNHHLLEDDPLEIAKFLHTSKRLLPARKREFLDRRRDVLDKLLQLQDFENLFLPNALRQLFTEISAPNERGNYLTDVIEKFSQRFITCNPTLGLSNDTVFVLCFSLIMLSVDLSSPHVKNKMSKREFIKNTCRAAGGVSDDLAGHLYDNIYLVGHVAPKK